MALEKYERGTKFTIEVDLPPGVDPSLILTRTIRSLEAEGAVVGASGLTDLISPSILTDYVLSPGQPSRLAITEDSMFDFVESIGVVKQAYRTFWDALYGHSVFSHPSSIGIPARSVGRYIRPRDRIVCNCPLRRVDYQEEYGIARHGLEPFTFLDLVNGWSEQPAVDLNRSFGARSVEKLFIVAERLSQDLGEAGLLGDPVV